jgi:hypothetical protein
MFDRKNNSVKQLWKNLNTVCNPRGSRATRETVTLLNIKPSRMQVIKIRRMLTSDVQVVAN